MHCILERTCIVHAISRNKTLIWTNTTTDVEDDRRQTLDYRLYLAAR